MRQPCVPTHRTGLDRIALVAVFGLGMMMAGWVRPGFAQEGLAAAKTAIANKEYDKAIPALRAVLEKNPKSEEAHYYLGLALKGKGQKNEALAELQEAVKIKSKYPDALYESGLLFLDKKQYDAALDTFEKGGAASKGQPRFLYGQGLVKMAQDSLTEAVVLLSKATTKDPKTALFHTGLGDAYAKRKVWDLAINEYNKALELDPNSPNAATVHYQIGLLHFESRRFEEAVEAYRKATTLNPNSTDAWYQLGYIYWIAKQYANAVGPLMKSTELQPNHFESNLYLAQALNKTRRLSDSVPYFEKAASLNPKSLESQEGLGDGLLAKGEYPKAAVAYQHAVDLDPNNAELLYKLGWTQSQAGVADTVMAVKNLQKALSIDSTSVRPYIQLAAVFFQQGRYEETLPYLQKAIALQPDDANQYELLGRCYIRRGLYADAVTAVRQSLDPVVVKNPKLSGVYFTLGVELYNLQRERDAKERRYDEAIAFLQRKVEIDTLSIPAYLNLGLCAMLKKDFPLAISTFQKAIQIKPENIQSRTFLASTYLQMNKMVEAKKEYEEILKIDAEHPDALTGLGNILLVEKRYTEGVVLLQRSIKARPGHMFTHLLLAQGYANSGQLDKAREEFREVLKLDPNNVDAKRGLQQLNEAAAKADKDN
ncbi:MAG: tetratricopeptide repeat protein [Candidatus Latescibacteria bacterium]|nr:tetratricopeptide repeat protein [Candidatus Latescibacterota bacterium]